MNFTQVTLFCLVRYVTSMFQIKFLTLLLKIFSVEEFLICRGKEFHSFGARILTLLSPVTVCVLGITRFSLCLVGTVLISLTKLKVKSHSGNDLFKILYVSMQVSRRHFLSIFNQFSLSIYGVARSYFLPFPTVTFAAKVLNFLYSMQLGLVCCSPHIRTVVQIA